MRFLSCSGNVYCENVIYNEVNSISQLVGTSLITRGFFFFFFSFWFCFYVVVIVGEIANFVAYIYASAVLWALLLGKYLFPFYTILNTIVVSISCFSPYTVSLWWFCTATKSSILVRGTKILSGMHVQGLKLVIFSYKN